MSYREKIYEQYTTVMQRHSHCVDIAAVDALYRVHFRGWFPNDKHIAILDAGCGAGQLLRFFLKQGYTNITGLDISPEQVECARKIHPNVIMGNALEFLQNHPGQFDVITGLDIIEHLCKDEAIRFLELAYRALRSNGRLILQTPNADTPFGLTLRYGDFTHEHCFTVEDLTRLIRLVGFKEIEPRETAIVLHGVCSLLRWCLWRILRWTFIVFNVVETGSPGSGIYTRVFIIKGVKS
jgi:2-polyprenyl-3-methyl-5-hydroxy-6-metoxy-1,4-benzoquinol methylase